MTEDEYREFLRDIFRIEQRRMEANSSIPSNEPINVENMIEYWGLEEKLYG